MRTVTLFLAGDVMTGRGIDQILPYPSAPELFESHVRDAREYVLLAEELSGPIPRGVSPGYVWGDALSELRRAEPHVRVVNLETSITRSDAAAPWKGIHYRMHPDNVACLTALELDVCALANNHVLDWGERGLLETLDVLDAARLRVAGAGRTAEEATRPAVVSVPDGGRVLVLGMAHASSGVPPAWAASPTAPGVWLLDDLSEDTAAAVGELARRAKRPGDVVVASVHWGSNWGYAIATSQVRFAHALVDSGIDVVHGHSSHHPRSLERYDGRLILYGCGDLLTDYEGIAGHEEFRGDLALMYLPEIDPTTGRLVRLRAVPLHLSRMRLERARPEDVMWLADRLGRVSRPFGADVVVAGEGGVLELAPEPVRAQVPRAVT
ncbi:MAG: CapA family protein [Labilithrix sp.]|nr:CapA family protein [Labilithrix sp.]